MPSNDDAWRDNYDAWKLASPDDEHDDDGDEEYDWLDQECHLGADGQCGLAGTEHCDFECPYRDSELFAGSEAWRKKHEKPA